MVRTICRTILLWSIGLISPAALAATGQIDNIAVTETAIPAGSKVDFTVYFSVQSALGSYEGSNPTEPDPQDGSQTWETGWRISESELLDSVFLEAGGQSFLDHPAVAPGALYSAIWSFSLEFPTAGVHQIDVTGGWTSNIQQISTSGIASRDCANIDVGGFDQLMCSVWVVADNTVTSDYPSVGSFDTRGVEIQVVAIPEPGKLALWPVGLAMLFGAVRQRRKRNSHG